MPAASSTLPTPAAARAASPPPPPEPGSGVPGARGARTHGRPRPRLPTRGVARAASPPAPPEPGSGVPGAANGGRARPRRPRPPPMPPPRPRPEACACVSRTCHRSSAVSSPGSSRRPRPPPELAPVPVSEPGAASAPDPACDARPCPGAYARGPALGSRRPTPKPRPRPPARLPECVPAGGGQPCLGARLLLTAAAAVPAPMRPCRPLASACDVLGEKLEPRVHAKPATPTPPTLCKHHHHPHAC
ncbi:basic proline-rich protein-like [Panicum virgatum]|uniref:basic proline-rich protein-like n=1 Tax=Panicum virgatum TaxID=38727 RepID=UPI0019D67DFB|nr:basic proline-rich protein-like [Panicum virgatum]